jgi:DNA-binding Lrp family transcriptional regulator
MTQMSRGGPSHAAQERQVVDAVDREILRALGEDARMSVAELARRANVSRANAYARIERLTSGGVIEGYEVRVNPRAIGLEVAALIFLTADQAGWREVWAKVQAIPEIEFIGLATGDYDLVVLVRTTSPETLRDVVLERFHSIPEIRTTRTMLLLDDVDRAPAVPDAPPVARRARSPRSSARSNV